jgi:teichuronic acid biosynthesis glycosyltransferase TuaG
VDIVSTSFKEYPNAIPLVSVIMPFYNTQEYVEGAIRSLMGQSFPNWELLAIDNNSLDDSSNIVERLQREDSRIRLFNEPRRGVSYARNLGLKLARGEYIAFIDSDDLYLPAKLESQLCFMREHPNISCCFTAHLGPDQSGNLARSLLDARSERLLSTSFLGYFLLASHYSPLLLNTAILRRNAIGSYMFDTSLRRGEDWDFLRRVLKGKTCGYICEPLYVCRRRKGSITNSDSSRWYYFDSRVRIYSRLLVEAPSLYLRLTAAKNLFWLLYTSIRSLRPLVESRRSAVSEESRLTRRS